MAAKTIEKPASFNDNYTEQDITHVHNIIDWMNASPSRSNRWLARCAGVSDAYISTLLAGRQAVKADGLIAKILPIMDDSEREHRPGDFIETSTWMIVQHACRMAKVDGGFSIVAGSPGVGKTESLMHYRELHPNTIYICGSSFMNSTSVMNALLKTLSIKTGTNHRKKDKFDAIVEQLKDSGRLIILDEADKCQQDTPDPLRSISDATGCGVVLAGNIDLRNNVAMGDNRFDLIESRVVFWPEIINKISPEDVKLLMQPYITEDMITKYETFDEVARYAFDLVGGSARKLIKSLIKQVLMLDKHSRENSASYGGISRELMAKIAKSYMGIAHPPAIPRKASAI
ncbi:hypothetical protein C6Y40_03725 [Alteromonas alba]|uniref:AAA+ ATPase domain-containing protein n=1 Tax=Alteromonas alba TaxID=2079529 RepID=A0A2S9VER1_9ALTE|nr:AAA family ATPase [Alteromonas alba]PRO74914.1 hypothetical protein C6Y40_03725 [Alteromonas alba]